MNTTGSTAGQATDEKQRQFARDTSQLTDIRRFVREWLGQRNVPSDVVDDFELAVSELATNATQHGSGPTIDIGLTVDVSGFTATVAAATEHMDGIGHVNTWRIAPPESLSGRGLGIVAAVMDVVEFSDDGDRAVFRCGRRR
ncbi:MAG: putative sigma factor regulation protein [Ilumatobacteraceae bacterium]|nr:putative sigma factor regulation protein [Ilumatobacteraceae bacterium]